VRLADRTHNLTSFRAVDFLEATVELQSQGQDIVRMGVGEPGFATAHPIAEAAKTAITEGKTSYTPPCGIPELRQAIANHYRDSYDLVIDPRRIIVTTGSSAALSMVCELLLNPGDGLLMSDPGYPCNPNFVRRLDAEPQFVPVDAVDNYQLTAERVASHWKANTVGVMVASPNNPTGEVISRDNLAALHREVSNRGGSLVVDEIYHGLTYEDEPVASILEITDEAFVINSFSKFFGMTGWRLGWMVVPEGVASIINVMIQNFYISSPTVSQYAALSAFEPETLSILEQRRAEFKQRRDFLVPALRELGFGVSHVPSGAFYVYADVQQFTDDCEAFCWKLLREHGVACTPGTDFGNHRASHHVRFTYTEPLERLQLGIERMRKALTKDTDIRRELNEIVSTL
jgi:aspartate/methionine/tyrosine aminotransferase